VDQEDAMGEQSTLDGTAMWDTAIDTRVDRKQGHEACRHSNRHDKSCGNARNVRPVRIGAGFSKETHHSSFRWFVSTMTNGLRPFVSLRSRSLQRALRQECIHITNSRSDTT
jgi:hypothetical protein